MANIQWEKYKDHAFNLNIEEPESNTYKVIVYFSEYFGGKAKHTWKYMGGQLDRNFDSEHSAKSCATNFAKKYIESRIKSRDSFKTILQSRIDEDPSTKGLHIEEWLPCEEDKENKLVLKISKDNVRKKFEITRKDLKNFYNNQRTNIGISIIEKTFQNVKSASW